MAFRDVAELNARGRRSTDQGSGPDPIPDTDAGVLSFACRHDLAREQSDWRTSIEQGPIATDGYQFRKKSAGIWRLDGVAI
jgi:hypothetical protein